MVSFLFKLLLLGVCSTVVLCQQDAGQVISNNIPAISGATTKYWNIIADDGSDLTLVNTFSLNEAGAEQDKTLIKRAVIVVHGFLNDAEDYQIDMQAALADTTQNHSTISRDSVAVIAPLFPNLERDRGVLAADEAGANGLIWSENTWYFGGPSIYPSNTSTVSSFSAMDQIIQYFDNKDNYPNLQHIVISGHSMGAMFVNRYAAIGKQLGTSASLSYYIADPNDYVWFNDQRPLDTSSCPTYNDWDTGLDNYPYTYNTDLVSQGAAAVQQNYNSRTFAYGRALRDMGDFPHGCGAYTTGDSRYSRFFAFIAAFPVAACNVSGICNTIDYVDTGHLDAVMFASLAGQARLFIDGFDGAAKAYDVYYPRIAAGDDPYPDPSQT